MTGPLAAETWTPHFPAMPIRLALVALCGALLVWSAPLANAQEGPEPDEPAAEAGPTGAEEGEPSPDEAPAETGPREPPPPIYEDQMLRLAEILGALHFLRELCGDGDAELWRAEMESLLAGEEPGPRRRSRLVGRFNHGFETFNAVYRSCTPSSRRAIALYLREGAELSRDMRTRYSQ